MACYLRPINNTVQAWEIDERRAVFLGGTVPPFEADDGEDIWDALKRQTPWFLPDGQNPFVKSLLEPGQYYPRMARPIHHHPTDYPGINPGAEQDAHAHALARGQMESLTHLLNRLCRTIHPARENWSVYGHEICNLLILACTEVEAHWRGVLAANGITRDRMTTRDYILLKDALRLGEYDVAFPNFPWLDPMSPFRDWRGANPTGSLPWFAAYNAVKHNRETDFSEGSLQHALEAIAGCAVMVVAQFGHNAFGHQSLARAFFHLEGMPRWSLSEIYVSGQPLAPVFYPF